MRRSRALPAAGISTIGLIAIVACSSRPSLHAASAVEAGTPAPVSTPPLVQAEPAKFADDADQPRPEEAKPSPHLGGLELSRIANSDEGFVAPAEGGTAKLTLDPVLQRTAMSIMAARHFPEAAVVMMEVSTGKLLIYASHVEKGPTRDLCVEATAPSASVFKIVTSAALIENAHVTADTTQCYSGGEQRISASDLVSDPQRDRWCTSLAEALGRSINTVFARLAKDNLTPSTLEAMARRLGYGDPFDFDAPVQSSALHIPADTLEFARTAAGFWNTTLSPLAAAYLSAIVARGGEAVRPWIVDQVVSSGGSVSWRAPPAPVTHRAIAPGTAEMLATMMERTITDGTCRRAFHDAHGLAYLPGLRVAGKTGTLTDADTQRYYTWFTGFAPARVAPDDVPQVAIAALVVNGPVWRAKANVLAREILRAYFASRGVKGVSRPFTDAVARHKR